MNASPPKSSSRSLPFASSRITTVACNAGIAVLFSIFAYAAWYSWWETGHIRLLILALQESLMVGLVITRHPSTHETRSPWDWGVALIGTIAPFFFRPGGVEIASLSDVGFVLQLVGLALSCFAMASLWRSYGIVAALRKVRTTGFYRIVRHPLYATYLIGYIGFLLANFSIANVIIITLATACQYIRAVAEERVLMNDPAYCDYMQRVRYRFLPFVF